MKIFITRVLPNSILELLTNEGHEIDSWQEKRNPTSEELIEKCQHSDALISIGANKLNRAFFDNASNLKVIALHSVGFDNVDIAAANEYKIPIGNTPGVLRKATADIAFLLMQNVARKAFYKHKEIGKGDAAFFEPLEDVGIDLQGKTLGIFGLGRIGFEMAKSAHLAFGMKIIYHNRSQNEAAEKELGASKVSFNEMLSQSDVISLHANLSDETKGLFDKKAFDKMKPSAIFINTARGAMHNETDLKAALENRTIWGAGLDVTNPEPMDKNNPLLNFPNTAILPHIGSATFETRMDMMRLCAENTIAGLKGEKLPHIVNPEIYDN